MTERNIFLAVIDLPDPPSRSAYLDGACGDDTGLRARVESLLRSHESAGDFLDTPAVVLPASETGASACGGSATPAGEGALDEDVLSFLAPAQQADSLGRIGHYEVLEVLGRGGFGIVFRAFDEALQRVVAVKVLAPQLAVTAPARKRFLREARSSAKVRHENVVQVHAVEEQPLPYLVMEFIPGETLQQRLDRTGPLETREVVEIGRQIAEALAAAHATGLVHRDVKPANVLLEAGGEERVKITDFGLARAADDASVSQAGLVAGTPLFMSPEQAKGEPVDQRTDLFSLGSVMYTMSTGRPPFRAGNTFAVLKCVAEDTPQAIAEIVPQTPKWLCDIIARLHARRPEDRFASAREVADLLGQAFKDEGGRMKDESCVEPSAFRLHPSSFLNHSSRIRRRSVIAALLLGSVIGLGITEATGVTHLAQTVIRVLVPDGTLVVEVGDPKVKVTVESNGGLVIAGAGPQEIRLRPGEYRVQANKDGKLIHKELVSITQGGTKTVTVRFEPTIAAPADPKLAAELNRLTSALDRNPNDRKARMDRAFLLRRLQRLDEAFADYSKVIETAPDDPAFSGAYVGRAEIRTLRRDWEGAISDYEARGKLEKTLFAAARIAIIRIFAPPPYRDAEKALGTFKKLMETNARDHGYNVGLGVAYYRLDRLEEAAATLERAATLAPGPNSYDQFALAMVYFRTGREEKARACYQKAKQAWTATAQQMGAHLFALESLRDEAAALLEPNAKAKQE